MADPASFERPGDEISGPTSTPASVISAGPGAGLAPPGPAPGIAATAMEVVDSIEEDFVNSVMDTSVEKIITPAPASQPTPVISPPKAAEPQTPTATTETSTPPGSVVAPVAVPPKPAGLSITPVAHPAKPPGMSVSAVSLTAQEGGEVKRVVPGLKIIGLSSELKKAMPMIQNEEEGDDDAEEDEDAEDEEESNSDEEDDDDSQEDDDEDEEEEGGGDGDDLEPPQKVVKPKGPLGRKVMQVSTPGTGYSPPKGTPKKGALARMQELEPPSTGKKRGRPSRQDLLMREQERQEAIGRGEPDPELKRKKRKPMKLNDVDSEEESKEERKRRKREEKEEKKRMRKLEKSEDTEDTEDEKPKKKGRKKKILNDDELAEREKERKRKYKEAREKQREKVEKRKQYLIRKREERKAQKVEEKIKHEEHMKRMAELRSQYLDDNAVDLPPPGTPVNESGFLIDENSQSSMGSVSVTNTERKKRKAWGDVGLSEMSGVHNPLANVTAENLFEYKWPLEGRHSEHYFLQEQVTEFLGVKSFKRKYPDCPRRTINMEERDFLIEMKIVNETQADLGLTAIPSTNVLDIMCQDFYERYELYLTVVNERKERSLRNYNYSSGGGSVKVEEAAKAAAEYNKRLNQERKTQRTAYFDMQTFSVQYPKTGKGKMKTLSRPPPGNYPVAMIPGQFVDCYRSYNSKELKFFPLNSVTSAPPKGGLTTRDLQLGSDGSESDSGSSSSGSSSDSDSDSDSESDAESKTQKAAKKIKQKAEKEDKKKEVKDEMVKDEVMKEEVKPGKKVDEVRPLATCKHCQGNPNQNKLGIPEILLHCTKCDNSSHPTCVGLHLDLLQFVTNYDWECTDCKKCMTCNDPADEDKMLFCDLCDRGFHIYCVGLGEIPGGRWHCGECSNCESCGSKTPAGDSGEKDETLDWIFETKTGTKGEKMYSHTMCHPCHKQWKKGSFCPECNGVFGRSKHSLVANCWVCQRQHHAACVGLDKPDARFICSACQRRTQEKIIAGGRQETPARNPNQGQNFSRTPVTASYSRSGRRVTQINFANQF